MRVATIKIALSGKYKLHFLDTSGSTRCGKPVPELLVIREMPADTDFAKHAEQYAGGSVCPDCASWAMASGVIRQHLKE